MFLINHEETTMFFKKKSLETWLLENCTVEALYALCTQEFYFLESHGYLYLPNSTIKAAKIFKRFKRDILDMLIKDADIYGYSSVCDYIQSWSCANVIRHDTARFKNAMVEYAISRIAHEHF